MPTADAVDGCSTIALYAVDVPYIVYMYPYILCVKHSKIYDFALEHGCCWREWWAEWNWNAYTQQTIGNKQRQLNDVILRTAQSPFSNGLLGESKADKKNAPALKRKSSLFNIL